MTKASKNPTVKSGKIDSDIVCQFLSHFPKVEGIYLFGSQVTNAVNPESDFDLGFLIDEKPSGEEALQLKLSLTNLLKSDVDLVDMRRADCVSNSQIVGTGRLLFCNDPTKLGHFEVVVLSKYAALNKEREGIIDDFTSPEQTI